jgi:hypothetical protein
MSRRKLDSLERRAGFLRARVAGGEADGVDLSYDKGELSALLWAIAKLRREVSEIPCARCGGDVVEFTVPNEVWNTVVRLDAPEGDDEYICEECYRKAVTLWVRLMGCRR